MKTPIGILFTTLCNLVQTSEEATALIAALQQVDVQTEWDKATAPYLRSCTGCGRSYRVTRTNAPKDGFCPICDNDINRTELQRVHKQCRRAIRAGMPATLTFRQWMETLQDFDHKCAYCQKFSFTDMEHFVPLKKGGGTTVDNVVPACSYCNWRKKSRNPNRSRNMRLDPVAISRVRSYLRNK